MRFRWFAAAAVVAPVVGCGSPDRVSGTEEAIAAVIAERLGEPVESVVVTCPDGADLDEGARLECEVAIGGTAETVVLDIGAGGTARLAHAVIPREAAEAYLVDQLSGPAESEVAVSCGEVPLLVGAVGDSFTCEAVRSSDSASFDVTVELTDLDGTVRYRVETTTSTTSSSGTTAPP